MNASPKTSAPTGSARTQRHPWSRLVLISALAIGMVSGAALLLFTCSADRQITARPAPPSVNPPDSPGTTLVTHVSAAIAPPAPSAPAGVEPATHAMLHPVAEPTPYSRQLVAALCPLDHSVIPGSQEQTAEWKQNLQQLVAQGPPAVAAI